MTILQPPSSAPRISERSDPDATTPVLVLGWGKALPAYRYSQAELTERLCQGLGPAPARRLRAAFRGARIEARHSVLPDFGAGEPRFPEGGATSTAQRMAVFAKEAPDLAAAAGRGAIENAGIDADSLTHLLFVTCTGLVSPGPDRTLVRDLGLSPSIRRVQIGFQGCSAGIVALRTASEIVRGDPNASVLVVSVELASLHFQADIEEVEVRGHALFADGAGAAVVAGRHAAQRARSRNGSARVRLLNGASRLVDGSAGDMTWDVGDTGFLMRLSARVPDALSEALPEFIRELTSEGSDEVLHWAIHPGGPVILDRIASALDIAPAQLAASHDVLRGCGNMSSATIFFVFERILELAAGPGIALAFGPGLTIEGLRFQVDA